MHSVFDGIHVVSADYGGCYANNAINAKPGNQTSGNGDATNKLGPNAVYIQPVSFKKLSYVLDQTPLNIFLDIVQTDSGFLETLNRSSNSTEMIVLTIKVLLKFVETPFAEHISVFLAKVCQKSNYWKQMEKMLKETTTKQPASAANTKQKKTKTTKVVLHRNDLELWEQIYALSLAISKRVDLPDGFVKAILAVITSNKNDTLNLNQFNGLFEQLLSDENCSNGTSNANHSINHIQEIYPSIDELKEEQKSYVKPNIINGRFSSIDEYLSIQSALLREDFIGPLRDGIRKVKTAAEMDPTAEPQSNFNVRVYPNVRIMIKQRENMNKSNFKSEFLMVDLEAKSRTETTSADANNNNNKYSKKLMYGSLLCFSTSTDFNDLLIAVVSNRDVDLLNQGYVTIASAWLICVFRSCFRNFFFSLSLSPFFRFRFKSRSSVRITLCRFSIKI